MSFSERRKEPRVFVKAEVFLRLEHETTKEFVGQLLDYSNSGFRAVHSCQDLSTGQPVHFRHPYGSGTARVVWKRILPDEPGSIETGFLVMD